MLQKKNPPTLKSTGYLPSNVRPFPDGPPDPGTLHGTNLVNVSRQRCSIAATARRIHIVERFPDG